MKPFRRHGLSIAAAIFFLVLATGCATKQVKGPNARIDLPDVHIEVDPSGNLPAKFWDSYSLFNKANKQFDKGNYDKARALYEKLAANYPNDELVALSVFNQALCLERTENYPQALEIYTYLNQHFAEKVGRVKLQFRFAYCYEKQERFDLARSSLQMIAQSPDATPVQKIQAEARIGIATFELGEKIKAKGQLRAAIGKYEEYRARKIPIDVFFYAKALYTLGEYYYEVFREVELSGEEKELELALERKAMQFILARAQYIKVIRSYDRQWAFASLYRIGEGYEHFYFAMADAPAPSDLTVEERVEYAAKLREEIAPVFEKALDAYRRNLRLAGDLDMSNEWIVKTQAKLKALEKWKQENL
jgi:tetratricopeptide (TPR) repeat protein